MKITNGLTFIFWTLQKIGVIQMWMGQWHIKREANIFLKAINKYIFLAPFYWNIWKLSSRFPDFIKATALGTCPYKARPVLLINLYSHHFTVCHFKDLEHNRKSTISPFSKKSFSTNLKLRSVAMIVYVVMITTEDSDAKQQAS